VCRSRYHRDVRLSERLQRKVRAPNPHPAATVARYQNRIKVSTDELTRAVESQQRGTATFVHSAPVREYFQGITVWNRVVLRDDGPHRATRTQALCGFRRSRLWASTIRPIGQIAKLKRVLDNDADCVTPQDMLAELRDDNEDIVTRMREAHTVSDEYGDVATASLIDVWIDEAERRLWFPFEASRTGDPTGD
jgi:hypothetical protein